MSDSRRNPRPRCDAAVRRAAAGEHPGLGRQQVGRRRPDSPDRCHYLARCASAHAVGTGRDRPVTRVCDRRARRRGRSRRRLPADLGRDPRPRPDALGSDRRRWPAQPWRRSGSAWSSGRCRRRLRGAAEGTAAQPAARRRRSSATTTTCRTRSTPCCSTRHMAYSCAYWTSDDPAYTVADAQRDKLDLICRKLDLEPGARLLDVGCGWGALSVHAAKEYGAHVTGVTISREQLAFGQARRRRRRHRAPRRPAAAGLPRPRRRPVRRDLDDRDGRARRCRQLPGVPRHAVRSAARRRPAADPADVARAQPSGRRPVHRVLHRARTCTCGRCPSCSG